jgi:hypothetical protein
MRVFLSPSLLLLIALSLSRSLSFPFVPMGPGRGGELWLDHIMVLEGHAIVGQIPPQIGLRNQDTQLA